MDSIQKFIEKNKSYTIKFSIGKYSDAFGFDNQIFNHDNYLKIFRLLESCKTWESSEEEVLEDYVEKFETIDSIILVCPNSPYDIIVKAQVEKEETPKEGYTKEIFTYKRKYHSFVLSNDKDFYIDIKIINNNIDSGYLAESSYLKILDIIKLFEKKQLEFKVLN
jgi:predicted RNA-binding protein associated with RNAse of E/G family